MNRIAGLVLRRLFVLALVTAMCASASATRAAGPPLKIAYSDWPGYLVWEIAKQKGFFKEAGVDVEMIWFEYGPCLDAFTAGKVEGAALVSGDSLVAGANGKPSTCIVLEDYSNGNDMIVGKAGVKSIKELKGKKVGLEQNLVEQLLLLKALEVNGMAESDLKIVNVSTNETPQTLASGGVDAIGAWYPISNQALKQVPGAKPLFTSAQAPGLIFDGLFVSRASLSSRRDDWKKVVGVWFKSMEYLDNPSTRPDAIKIMAGRISAKPAELERNMKGTALLGREGNANSLLKKDQTLGTLHGSLINANAFNLKYKVYKDSQDVSTYYDPSLVIEVTGDKK